MNKLNWSQSDHQKKVLEWARYYLECGFSVIPLKAKSKKPHIHWKKYQETKPTIDNILDWWAKWPDANIGIVTGTISRIIVLDADGQEGLNTLSKLNPPKTWKVTTDNGCHLYFRHPGSFIQNFVKKLHGIDLRCDGGYIVAPPSLHPNGSHYCWSFGPNQNASLADFPNRILHPVQNQTNHSSQRIVRNLARFPQDKWSIILNGVEEGTRHKNALKLAGHYIERGLGVAETEIILRDFGERCTPPMDQTEIHQIVKDVHTKEERLFSDPEPWPDPVNLSELLTELVGTINRFAITPQYADITIVLWIIHVWVLDAFTISPILRIKSPTKGCGKTTLLIVIKKLLPRCLASSDVTPATIFRLVETHKVSLCIDEVDSKFGKNDDLISLVNSGYTRETAYVPRCEGENFKPKLFSSWCGKVLAGIGKLTETTEQRAIQIMMRKKIKGEKIKRLRLDSLEPFESLRRKCFRFAAGHVEDLKNAEPAMPEKLGDRPQDNFRPLMAIADLAGGEWPQKARDAALVISGAGTEDETGLGEQLLGDLKKIFDKATQEEGYDKLPTGWIVQRLAENEEAPWGTYNQGEEITPKQLARLLKPFGAKSRDLRWEGKILKGYYLIDLKDAFTRYIP